MAEGQNSTSSSSEDDYELVRQLADLVYKMLLEEARINYERRQISRHIQRYPGG